MPLPYMSNSRFYRNAAHGTEAGCLVHINHDHFRMGFAHVACDVKYLLVHNKFQLVLDYLGGRTPHLIPVPAHSTTCVVCRTVLKEVCVSWCVDHFLDPEQRILLNFEDALHAQRD
jgi:hypothetical protein